MIYILFCVELEVTKWKNVLMMMIVMLLIVSVSTSSSIKEEDRSIIIKTHPLLHSFDSPGWARVSEWHSVRMVDKQPFVTQFCVKIQGKEWLNIMHYHIYHRQHTYTSSILHYHRHRHNFAIIIITDIIIIITINIIALSKQIIISTT